MDLEQAFHEAAHAAEAAVTAAMGKYKSGNVTDEDDLTGVLIGRLDSAFDQSYGGINWSSSILRHRKGIAAQERRVGADMLIHVSLNTPGLTYSKGVLIQAKRVEPNSLMSVAEHNELTAQCGKMLAVSPASFVFDYAKTGMRCASANRIFGSNTRELHSACNLTPYRFFLELFRCTIGDQKIDSAIVDKLNVPEGIHLTGTVESPRQRRRMQ
ncbi:hypothetical protein [Pseudomonas brassicacearum]|jgi:hypothetical protein|uniref:hypothetical protein n=1 Tax=Pseudomonas brassicacearum TaxID=930166 RepID=UPI0009B88273|nr:hypothetical protein [Pseudomonas brassicacearum]